MIYKTSGEKYLLRFERGENFLEEFTRFANETKINSGNFEGLGSFDKCELGYYNPQKKTYTRRTFDVTNEVVGLLGNLSSLEGKPYFHAHVTLSDQEFNTRGGHLFSATVGATLEINFEKIPVDLGRKFNDEVGLNLLDL